MDTTSSKSPSIGSSDSDGSLFLGRPGVHEGDVTMTGILCEGGSNDDDDDCGGSGAVVMVVLVMLVVVVAVLSDACSGGLSSSLVGVTGDN